MPKAERKLCTGSGEATTDVRTYRGTELLAKCPICGRILKPMTHYTKVPGFTTTALFVLRQHSIRGKNTASHDSTMGILWDHARKAG